jgi:hypothetical protein
MNRLIPSGDVHLTRVPLAVIRFALSQRHRVIALTDLSIEVPEVFLVDGPIQILPWIVEDLAKELIIMRKFVWEIALIVLTFFHPAPYTAPPAAKKEAVVDGKQNIVFSGLRPGAGHGAEGFLVVKEFN